MNRLIPSARPARAFTLMEVLLAVAVSAVVLAAVSAVYFSALNLRNRTVEALEQSLPLEHTLTILRSDLAGLMAPGGTLSGQFQSSPTTNITTDFSGQRISPDFRTCSAVVDDTSPFAEVQRVAYYLAQPTNAVIGRDLVRLLWRNLLASSIEEPQEQRLLGGIQDLQFRYYDGSAWLDTWDSTTSSNLPSAILVRLHLANPGRNQSQDAPIELLVPVLAQARPQAGEDATGGAP